MHQTLIVVSSPMVWTNTPTRKDAYTDGEMNQRVPLPKYQQLKQIEIAAMSLNQNNDMTRVHIVCSGFLYGNGEQNNLFYEFFRCAWVSLHP